jgi:hypothetical protein
MAVAGGYVQWLVETTPNGELNPSALSTLPFYHPLQNRAWDIPILTDDRTDELRGVTDNVQKDVVGYDPQTWSANLRLYPNLFGLWMWATHGPGTFTAGNGAITDPDSVVMPASTNRWVWTAGTNNGPQRSLQAQIVYPDQSVFIIQKGCVCESLQVGYNGEVATLSATGHSLYTAQQADPALTPAYDALTVKPFFRSMMGQPGTWLASTGTHSSFALTLANPVSFDRTLSGSMWPDVVDRTGVDLNLTATVDIRNLTTADIAGLRAGTGFTVKQKWIHTSFITGSYPYKLFIEGNAMYADTNPEPLAHKIRHGGTFTVDFGRSSGGTPSYTITLCNGVASYSSVG